MLPLWLLQSRLEGQQPSEDSEARLAETLEENQMLQSELEDLLRDKEELGQFLKQQVEPPNTYKLPLWEDSADV